MNNVDSHSLRGLPIRANACGIVCVLSEPLAAYARASLRVLASWGFRIATCRDSWIRDIFSRLAVFQRHYRVLRKSAWVDSINTNQ